MTERSETQPGGGAHHDLDAVLAEERELMNFYAPNYRALQFFNSYYYQQERRCFVDWILKTVRAAGRDPAGLAFLDVGSGTGEILEPLAAAGCANLTGIDIAEKMITESKRHVPGARLVHDSLERHDWGEERFDVITACLTVHHMCEPAAFFRFADRHLSPGGWFFLMEYNRGGWGHESPLAKPIGWLMTPLRKAIKIKNRGPISRLPSAPPLFNHAHDILRFRDILDAMPERENYEIKRYTRGIFVPTLTNALVPDSRADRAVYRVLSVVDRIAEPFQAGYMQGVGARRLR
ncbi:MAG: class I SAM-dependent methyltransferase [Gemmatimonadetes bacterium]|nr:class I SAM-dependent methyltransferase [Gemmatimonadota bacterium]